MVTIELTDRELRLANANIAYAIENCPVEGGIMTDAGHFSTKQSFDELLKKLQAVEIKPTNILNVSDEEFEFLIAASTYALEYCRKTEGRSMVIVFGLLRKKPDISFSLNHTVEKIAPRS